MAGLGSLDDLYNTFLGQTNTALGQQDQPWQQELMESVNPDKVRRDNIKRALAQASMALATTPGNFLQGLSTAAGVGANSYLQQKQDAEEQRMKAMQLVQVAQQKQQDRRLSLLLGAIGVNRDIASDKRADRESDSRVNYYNRRGVGGSDNSGGYSPAQIGAFKRSIQSQLHALDTDLRDPNKYPDITEDEIQQRLMEEQARLEQYYGIDSSYDGPQSVMPGKTDQTISKSPTVKAPGGAGKPITADVRRDAQAAIDQGADPAEIRQRLIDNGYDVTGF